MSFRNASFHQAVNIGDAKAIEAMMADGADVNAPNESGQTPIIHAIIVGQYHLLSVLLKAGANLSQRDATGLNAIDWAKRKGRPDLAQSLSRHSLSPNSSTDVARVDPAQPATQPPAETTQRQALSADEKSRRFIAGLKQRMAEQANRDLTIEQPPSHKPTSRETLHEPQPAVRKIPTREEVIAEPVRERPARKEVIAEPVRKVPAREEVIAELIREMPTREEVIVEPVREMPAREEVIAELMREMPARKEVFAEPVGEVVPTVKEKPASETLSEPHVETLQQPSAAASTLTDQKVSSTSHRKRCPQCGATYDSELLGYCAHHVVALVDVDTPIATPEVRNALPMLWILVVMGLVLGALGGLLLTWDLFNKETISTPAQVAPEPVSQKGMPFLGRQLDGKAVSLPEAEVPANTVKEPVTVLVRVRIDREGRVVAASSNHVDQVLRDAAIEAARKSTFSVEKLRRRSAGGTIRYTFK